MTATLAAALAALLLAQISAGVLSLQDLVRRGNWSAAVKAGEDLVKRDPGDPHAHYLLGVALWQAEDKVGAIQAFRSAERLDLDASYLHMALGLAYYEVNQFLLFERQMLKAASSDPSDARPLIHLGRYYESVVNDFERALDYFDKALQLDPASTDGLFLRAYCLEGLQRTEAAREAYVAAAAAGSHRASVGMARILADIDPQAALRWATRAVRDNPEIAEAAFIRSRVLLALDRDNEALEAINLAIRLDPDHPEAHFLLYRALRSMGRTTEAAEVLATFKELREAYGDY